MEGKRELNYWPAFVDALSGLTLALVLVMVIFVVAMFSFAAELSKRKVNAEVEAERAKFAAAAENVRETSSIVSSPSSDDSRSTEAAVIASLQQQIDKLKSQLRKVDSSNPRDTVEVRRKEDKASDASGVSVDAVGNGGIVVRFSIGNVALTPDSQSRFEQALGAALRLMPDAVVDLEATIGSETYSEARRNAYFRLMSVRNVVIDRDVLPQRIESRINDTAAAEKAGEGSVIIRLRRK